MRRATIGVRGIGGVPDDSAHSVSSAKPRRTANDERDDIKALIKIVENLDVNLAALLTVMRDIQAQIKRIASYVDELRQKGGR